jgi:hypothetical protein
MLLPLLLPLNNQMMMLNKVMLVVLLVRFTISPDL